MRGRRIVVLNYFALCTACFVIYIFLSKVSSTLNPSLLGEYGNYIEKYVSKIASYIPDIP